MTATTFQLNNLTAAGFMLNLNDDTVLAALNKKKRKKPKLTPTRAKTAPTETPKTTTQKRAVPKRDRGNGFANGSWRVNSSGGLVINQHVAAAAVEMPLIETFVSSFDPVGFLKGCPLYKLFVSAKTGLAAQTNAASTAARDFKLQTIPSLSSAAHSSSAKAINWVKTAITDRDVVTGMATALCATAAVMTGNFATATVVAASGIAIHHIAQMPRAHAAIDFKMPKFGIPRKLITACGAILLTLGIGLMAPTDLGNKSAEVAPQPTPVASQPAAVQMKADTAPIGMTQARTTPFWYDLAYNTDAPVSVAAPSTIKINPLTVEEAPPLKAKEAPVVVHIKPTATKTKLTQPTADKPTTIKTEQVKRTLKTVEMPSTYQTVMTAAQFGKLSSGTQEALKANAGAMAHEDYAPISEEKARGAVKAFVAAATELTGDFRNAANNKTGLELYKLSFGIATDGDIFSASDLYTAKARTSHMLLKGVTGIEKDPLRAAFYAYIGDPDNSMRNADWAELKRKHPKEVQRAIADVKTQNDCRMFGPRTKWSMANIAAAIKAKAALN